MTTLDTTKPAPERSRRPSLKWLSRYGTLLAFLALIAFNVAVTPNFLSWQTLNVNLTQVATIVIVAVGMTLVIATGGIDLSVGSLMAIAKACSPVAAESTRYPSYWRLSSKITRSSASSSTTMTACTIVILRAPGEGRPETRCPDLAR